MVLLKKIWRESASMIICGRNPNNAFVNECNYKVLMMKRSSNSSFMPNVTAFPGGLIEPSDSQSEWLSYYKSKSVSRQQLDTLRPTQRVRPFIYDKTHCVHRTSDIPAPDEALERDVSLRLTAIREIFEEVGLLIGQNVTNKDSTKLGGLTTSNFAELAMVENAKHWQDAVHEDAQQFLKLCETCGVIPDVWNLFEWANWLTPTTFMDKRYDTAFYLAALQSQPDIIAEATEVQEYLWASPIEIIRMYREKELQLAPPQLYELSRLTNLDNIDSVASFAKQRSPFGVTHFYPVYYKLKLSHVFVYPGDDYYPVDLDYVGDTHNYERFMGITSDEFRAQTRNVHRTEHTKEGVMKIYSNVESSNCHLNPIVAATIVTRSGKL